MKKLIVVVIMAQILWFPTKAGTITMPARELIEDNSVVLIQGENTVWWIKDGERMAFSEPDTFFSYGFTWSDLQKINPATLLQYSDKGIIKSQDKIDKEIYYPKLLELGILVFNGDAELNALKKVGRAYKITYEVLKNKPNVSGVMISFEPFYVMCGGIVSNGCAYYIKDKIRLMIVKTEVIADSKYPVGKELDYVVLHEFAHISGITDEIKADEQAKRWLLEDELKK